ncbi:FadR/GntR family transcriptional regulator [Palleronia sp. KMU-117]|uniref:FadR/GntR family transcriptional regulator n=1 Tax=Palleronia sp. KMU-117 TaxID=3434108 RepID=UPI003D736915
MQRSDHNVRDYLTSAIDRGAFAPGARLPTERELCEQLAVSRSAVRNALAVLEGEGRIVRIAGSGTYVSGAEANTNAAIRDLPMVTSPAQVMEARLTIEPQLAQLVASNGTAADFAAMQRCHEAGVAAKTLEEFETWDAALHEVIAEAARNPLVVEAYNLITRARDHGEWGALKKRSLTPERRAQYEADHERIVAALRQRDADLGEQELRKHLLRVRSNLLGL